MLLLETAAPATVFEPDLFNTEAYAELHAGRFAKEVRCVWTSPGQSGAAGVFQAAEVRPGVFASPGRGPYGGFDMAGDASEEEMAAFVCEAEAAMRGAGAWEVEVVLPPFCYAPVDGPRLLPVLCGLGYRVVRQELNQAIAIGGAEFAAQGSHANRKSLRRAEWAGITVRELGPGEQRVGYGAVLENRESKGRPLSMTWEEVEAMLQAFPERVRVFGAEQAGRVVAGGITVKVNRRVLYVYAWGERPGTEENSPVSSLAAHLYGYAREQGFGVLDLGTSSVDGVVNAGLERFKRGLGATHSLKLWVSKVLR